MLIMQSQDQLLRKHIFFRTMNDSVILAYSNSDTNSSDMKKMEPLNNFKYYT